MKRNKSKAYNLDDLSLGEVLRLTRVGEFWNGVHRANYYKAMHNLRVTRGLEFKVINYEFEVWVCRTR